MSLKPDGEPVLYRGVDAGHPAFQTALQGIAVPGKLNGNVTAAEHNLAGRADIQANSPYTSFTTRFDVARNHALKAGAGGIILVAELGAPSPGDAWLWVFSPDEYGEQEILLHGIRAGLGVVRP